MDRFEALSTFAAVAETGAFSAAARALGRSPAVVTRTIAALEQDLSTPLFRRTTRVVSLTEAGASYLIDAKRILADVEESRARVRGAHDSLRGGLAVTASVLFGRMHVAPILFPFMRAHPEVRVRALLVDRVVDLLEEGIDVAIRIAHLRDSALRAAKVGSVRRVLCASPAYLAEHGRPRQPADLQKHSIVAFAMGAPPRDWSFSRARRVQRVRIDPVLVTNSTEASIAAAIDGHGITRALSYQIAAEVRRGDLAIVLREHEPPPIPIHVVHGGGSARVRAFVDYAVDRLRKERLR